MSPAILSRIAGLLVPCTLGCAELPVSSPKPPESVYLPTGTRPRLLRLTLPSAPSAAAACSEDCASLERVEDSYYQCLSRCPGTRLDWDAECSSRAAKAGRCFERIAAVPAPEEAVTAAEEAEVASNVMAVMALIGSYVLVFYACSEQTQGPGCWATPDPSLNPAPQY